VPTFHGTPHRNLPVSSRLRVIAADKYVELFIILEATTVKIIQL
jgi:hypothetical protein